MLFEPLEPNERFRARREAARRRRRRRRAVLVGLLLGATATLAVGARFVIGDEQPTAVPTRDAPQKRAAVETRRGSCARSPTRFGAST